MHAKSTQKKHNMPKKNTNPAPAAQAKKPNQGGELMRFADSLVKRIAAHVEAYQKMDAHLREPGLRLYCILAAACLYSAECTVAQVHTTQAQMV